MMILSFVDLQLVLGQILPDNNTPPPPPCQIPPGHIYTIQKYIINNTYYVICSLHNMYINVLLTNSL